MDDEGTEDEMEEEQVEGGGLLMSAGSFHTQTAIDDTQGDIDPEEVLKTYYETYTKEEKTWYRWGHSAQSFTCLGIYLQCTQSLIILPFKMYSSQSITAQLFFQEKF